MKIFIFNDNDNKTNNLYDKIKILTENPFQPQVEKLKGFEGDRLRIGDYRILFDLETDEKIVTIYAVRHRREAYR